MMLGSVFQDFLPSSDKSQDSGMKMTMCVSPPPGSEKTFPNTLAKKPSIVLDQIKSLGGIKIKLEATWSQMLTANSCQIALDH